MSHHRCAVHCPRGGAWWWLPVSLVLAALVVAALVWLGAHALVLAALVAPPVAVAVAAVAWMVAAAHGTPPWLKPAVVVRPVRVTRPALRAPARAITSPATVTVLASRHEEVRREVPEPPGVQALRQRRFTGTGGPVDAESPRHSG